jgi:multidrug resistance efflux pump
VLRVLAVCGVVLVYHLFADRLTPYSAQANVRAYVVGIAPQVAGAVIEIGVEDNAKVGEADVLFRLDPDRYRQSVEQAEADLAKAGQSIGASTAQVAAAAAELSEAEAELRAVRENAGRVLKLVADGWYPPARGDRARAQLEAAQAEVRKAEADLREARERLGPEGRDNPDIRAASARLERARRDLLDTVVRAPSEGLVTNLQSSVGRYAAVGQPVMTFIDIRSVWVDAAFRENNLGNLEPGDRAAVVLDVRPGRVFEATVESLGWGVSTRSRGGSADAGDLPTIRNDTEWLRDAQRFPVRIRFDGADLPRGIRVGSQASVLVYTGDDLVLNAIGWLRIRAVSLLTYLY